MAVKPDCLKDLHVPNFYIAGSRRTEVKTKDHLGYTEDFADDQPISKEIRSGICKRQHVRSEIQILFWRS